MDISRMFAKFQSGERDKVLEQLAKAYRRSPSNRLANAVIRAHLLIEDFASALRWTEEAIHTSGDRSNSMLSCLGGVACWCSGRREDAVEWWRSGLNSRLGDSGGANVGPVLRLYDASVNDPSLFPPKEIAKLLREKAADRRAKHWPGRLTWMLAGVAGEAEVLEPDEFEDPKFHYLRVWVMGYYRGLQALAAGDTASHSREMRLFIDAASNVSDTQHPFVDFVYHDEFFLGRQERTKGTSS